MGEKGRAGGLGGLQTTQAGLYFYGHITTFHLRVHLGFFSFTLNRNFSMSERVSVADLVALAKVEVESP